MENPTEFFRKILTEFRAADDLLSKQTKTAEDRASTQQIEITHKAEEAERAATGYLHAIDVTGHFKTSQSGSNQNRPL
jgi:hypothetical protein